MNAPTMREQLARLVAALIERLEEQAGPVDSAAVAEVRKLAELVDTLERKERTNVPTVG